MMSALKWERVFATLNPSPVFETAALLGRLQALNRGESPGKTRSGEKRSVSRNRWLSDELKGITLQVPESSGVRAVGGERSGIFSHASSSPDQPAMIERTIEASAT